MARLVPTKRSAVLIVDFENGDGGLKDQFRKLAEVKGTDVAAIRHKLYCEKYKYLPMAVNAGYLKGEVEKVRKNSGEEEVLVVIDSAGSAFRGLIDAKQAASWENDNGLVASVLEPLKRLCEDDGSITLVVLHHANKQTGEAIGAVQWGRTPDYLHAYDKEGHILSNRTGRYFSSLKPQDLIVERNEDCSLSAMLLLEREVKAITAKKVELWQKILNVLPTLESDALPVRQIIDLLKINRDTVIEALKEMRDSGAINFKSGGKAILHWRKEGALFADAQQLLEMVKSEPVLA